MYNTLHIYIYITLYFTFNFFVQDENTIQVVEGVCVALVELKSDVIYSVYTKTHQVHDSGMSEDVEYYHTTNHYHDTATFLKICNDIRVL